MAENGYTLVSSTVANGLTIDIWSPVSETIAKRSPLLPASLPGAKGGLLTPHKREPSLSPSELRRRDSVGTTALEKRDAIDIQGRKCSTACGFQNWQHADTNDCASAYEQLYSIPGTFTLVPRQALSATSNKKTCSIWTVNHSSSNISTSVSPPLVLEIPGCSDIPFSVRPLGCGRDWSVAQRGMSHKPRRHCWRMSVRRHRHQYHERCVHCRVPSDVYDGHVDGVSTGQRFVGNAANFAVLLPESSALS
jgi:hypothetical protein